MYLIKKLSSLYVFLHSSVAEHNFFMYSSSTIAASSIAASLNGMHWHIRTGIQFIDLLNRLTALTGVEQVWWTNFCFCFCIFLPPINLIILKNMQWVPACALGFILIIKWNNGTRCWQHARPRGSFADVVVCVYNRPTTTLNFQDQILMRVIRIYVEM